jgi:hypothetical protein
LQVPELAFPDALSGFLQEFHPSKNRFFATTVVVSFEPQFFFEFGFGFRCLSRRKRMLLL